MVSYSTLTSHWLPQFSDLITGTRCMHMRMSSKCWHFLGSLANLRAEHGCCPPAGSCRYYWVVGMQLEIRCCKCLRKSHWWVKYDDCFIWKAFYTTIYSYILTSLLPFKCIAVSYSLWPKTPSIYLEVTEHRGDVYGLPHCVGYRSTDKYPIILY